MTTLAQYLLHHLAAHPDHRQLALFMNDLATIGKIISRETNRAGVAGILGTAGTVNVQGEQVQQLDVFANELCKTYLAQSGHVAALASEEEESPVDMGESGANAEYIIAFDPLDGSSNIDVNGSIGTIFSVHKRLPGIPHSDERQFLQPGRDQVLAGYILYGSSTVLVCSFADGVHEFTLDQTLGEFLLSNEHMQLPAVCPYYSVNEANVKYMSEKDRAYVSWLRDESGASARYVGALVADVHRTLVKGGVFLYPAIDSKRTGNYAGKLRLNYELKPLAFLIEQAGGVATNGSARILDLVPTALHERQPIFLGTKEMIAQYSSL